MTDLTTHVTYWFDANMWFDRNQGDGLIERVLMALPAEPRIRRCDCRVSKSQVAGYFLHLKLVLQMGGVHGLACRAPHPEVP